MQIYQNLRYLLLPVIAIIGIEFIGIAICYWLYIQKLKPKGKTPPLVKQLALGAILIGYIVFVLELTMFGRGTSYYLQMDLRPLSGYMEAWHKHSLRDLQNGIFNILMFVPMGVLLPWIHPKFRTFKWLVLVALGATLSIETYQTLSGAGLFEMDDIINNTLGGIIGYQLHRLATSIIRDKRIRLRILLANLAIPFLMVMVLIAANILYARQEFGNLAINEYTKWNMSGVRVTSALQPGAAPSVAPVYKRIIHTDAIQPQLMQTLGLTVQDERKENGEREVLLADEAGSQYSLYLTSDGNASLHENGAEPEPEPTFNRTDGRQPTLKQAQTIMSELGLLPQKAEAEKGEGGEFHWSLPDTDRISQDYWTGEISLTLKQDGRLNSLSYGLRKHQYVRDVAILTPAEAYERIREGKFPLLKRNALLTHDQLVIHQGDRLDITRIELTHMYDTKGFYQPVYRIYGNFNGDANWFTLIQASK